MIIENTLLLLGTYHQYDTVAYPKKTKVTKTWTEKAKATVAGFLGWSQTLKSTENVKELELKPLSSQEMRKYCLEAYLDGYKKMLSSGNFPQPFNIHKLVEDIRRIYNSLLYCLTSAVRVEKKAGFLQEVSFNVGFPSLHLAECITNYILSLFLTVCRS